MRDPSAEAAATIITITIATSLRWWLLVSLNSLSLGLFVFSPPTNTYTHSLRRQFTPRPSSLSLTCLYWLRVVSLICTDAAAESSVRAHAIVDRRNNCEHTILNKNQQSGEHGFANMEWGEQERQWI